MSRLRLFADHCVANSVLEAIRRLGHEVIRLRDRLPADSSDPVVIHQAQQEHAILLTLNGDFTDIVSYPP